MPVVDEFSYQTISLCYNKFAKPTTSLNPVIFYTMFGDCSRLIPHLLLYWLQTRVSERNLQSKKQKKNCIRVAHLSFHHWWISSESLSNRCSDERPAMHAGIDNLFVALFKVLSQHIANFRFRLNIFTASGDCGRQRSLLLLSRLQSGSPKGTCNQKNKRKIVLE